MNKQKRNRQTKDKLKCGLDWTKTRKWIDIIRTNGWNMAVKHTYVSTGYVQW